VRRALIVCPGRGSYGRDTLGSLKGRSADARAVIDACDAHRASRGLPTVSELDADATFKADRHLAGEHASLLTFAASLADLAELSPSFEIVAVTGNSMGWYTALAAAGALSIADGIRLVDTMGGYQAEQVIGGQLIQPLAGEDGRVDPARLAAVEAALARASEVGVAAWSIRLGTFAVLGGDEAGLAALQAHLPQETRGARTFPTRLPKHAAFHTALMRDTSARALRDLAGLRFTAPRVPLIDGRGVVHRPLWADPEALRSYTLGHQVTEPYDLDAAVRTALHHAAPDVVVLLGPGDSLGGPVLGMLLADGWHGARTKVELDAAQAREPRGLSFGRKEQRAVLVAR
jgi:acyl transferase domain-containing protein